MTFNEKYLNGKKSKGCKTGKLKCDNKLTKEVLITNVDNSPATTMSLSNPYTCENTNDKVFLLSYADYKNSDYGYIEDSYGKCDLRLTRVTDYALANYAYHYDAGLYNGCTYVWTRSPSYEDEKSIHVVFANKKDVFY